MLSNAQHHFGVTKSTWFVMDFLECRSTECIIQNSSLIWHLYVLIFYRLLLLSLFRLCWGGALYVLLRIPASLIALVECTFWNCHCQSHLSIVLAEDEQLLRYDRFSWSFTNVNGTLSDSFVNSFECASIRPKFIIFDGNWVNFLYQILWSLMKIGESSRFISPGRVSVFLSAFLSGYTCKIALIP